MGFGDTKILLTRNRTTATVRAMRRLFFSGKGTAPAKKFPGTRFLASLPEFINLLVSKAVKH